MKAKLKKLHKLICIILTSLLILSFGDYNIKQESRSSNVNLNKNVNLNSMAKVINKFVKTDINIPLDTYYGTLTGYVADCPLCSGYLACNNQNVLDRTTTYTDKTYGVVRIVASSRILPCGSIVRFNKNNKEITAIVLDRGVVGTALDLLVESDYIAITEVGNKKINYDILRFGWTRDEL